MQPKEERPSRSLPHPVFIKPSQRTSHALPCFAVDQSDVFLLKCLRGEGVVVKIETTCQSPIAIQDERADDCAGGVALLLENLGHRAEALIERLPGKVLHSILERIGAGQ